MISKGLISQKSNESGSPRKKSRTLDRSNYYYKCLQESGFILNNPPEKCLSSHETIHVILNIKKNVQNHFEYPRNLTEFFCGLEKRCQNLDIFKHYLFPNIIRTNGDDEHVLKDSVFKILLNVPILQNKLTDYIFEKAIDLAAESKCGPWIQMILKCFSTLDSIEDTDRISSHLINLLDIASEKAVRLEIITAIPDIVGDKNHNNVAAELNRILNEDHDFVPAILDCLSYLCLSDNQYEQLQKKTLDVLRAISHCNYFSNFLMRKYFCV